MQLTKANRRRRIHNRVRKKITGTPARPRLTVFRSNKSIYAQIIDDLSGHTIVSASSLEAAVEKSVNKSEQAKAVGKILAERAVQADRKSVV